MKALYKNTETELSASVITHNFPLTEENVLIKHDLDNMKALYKNTETELSASVITHNFPSTEEIFSFQIHNSGVIDLIKIYQRLFKSTMQEIKDIFKQNEKIETYITNINPVAIITFSEYTQIGIIFLHYESSVTDKAILSISGVALSKDYLFSDFLSSALKYIKSNFIFNEINVNLHFTLSNNKFEINEAIKNLFLKENDFRWSNLENSVIDGKPNRSIKTVHRNQKEQELSAIE